MAAANRGKGTTIEADYVWVSERETFREKVYRLAGDFWRWIGLRGRRMWRWISWFFASAIRWVFLSTMFLYLFTMALALFEADSFQVLVGQLAVNSDDSGAPAGTPRIREIIQTVRDEDVKKTREQNEKAFAEYKKKLNADAAETTGSDGAAQASEMKREEKTVPAGRKDETGEGQQQGQADQKQKTEGKEQPPQADEKAGEKAGQRIVQEGERNASADKERNEQEIRKFVATVKEAGEENTDLATLRQFVVSELDDLHAVTNGIDSISGANVSVVFKTSQEGQNTARQRFAELVATLQERVDSLKQRIGVADPVSEALIEFDEVIEQLSDFEIKSTVPGIKSGSDSINDDLHRLVDKEEEQFRKEIKLAELRARQLMALLRSDRGGLTMPKAFKDLENGLTALKQLRLQAEQMHGFTIQLKREDLEEKPVERKQDVPVPKPLGQLALSQTSDGIGDLRTILGAIGGKYKAKPENGSDNKTYDRNLQAALIQFQTDNFGKPAADENVGPDTVAALKDALTKEQAEEQKEQKGDSESPEPRDTNQEKKVLKLAQNAEEAQELLDTAAATLRVAFQRLKSAGIAQSAELGEIRELTGPVSEMIAAADALDRIEVSVEIPSNLSALQGTKVAGNQKEAGAKLAQAGERLKKLYQKLNTAFEKSKEKDDALRIYMIAEAIGLEDPRATAKATQIWHEYQAMARFQPVLIPLEILRAPGGSVACQEYNSPWERFKCAALGMGFKAKEIAAWPRQSLDLMFVFVLGAIGSLIYITQRQLREIISGHGIKGNGPTEYFSWYFFRPIFGIVIAFAIYLLYKTGAGALGSGTDSVLAAEVNLPMLALIALFAGLLSWQALEVIETRGRNWLKSQRRENLYASGVEAALRNAGYSSAELATQIGRTPTQVDRWIAGQDKVTPEMQDRISTWLDRQLPELFSDQKIADSEKSKMRWATGLKRALDNSETSMDAETLAVLLEKDPETVRAWKELQRQVDPQSQLLIAETLKMRPAELFDQVRPDQDWWAHGLRAGLQSSTSSIKNTRDLAAKIGSSPENIRRYMELAIPVPKAVRDEISKALDMAHSQLFTPNRPKVSDFLWAAGLRYAMQESELKRAAQLAEAIDADLFKVRSWMEMEICEAEDGPPYCGQVATATRKRMVLALGESAEKLFSAERAEREFLWAVTPDFQQAVEAHGGAFELAERIDVDQARLQRWIDGAEPIAPATRVRIKRELGLSLEDESLFEWRQPGREQAAPEGTWWATMLRDGLERRGKRVADLAGEVGIAEDVLHGYIELEEEVSKPIREKILRRLSFENDQLFSKVRPEPSEFRWATNLRSMMTQKTMTSAELALAIDGDVRRVRAWMDFGPEDPKAIWKDGRGNSVKFGQVAPATQKRLAEALGCAVNDLFNMLDNEPPKDTEPRWVVRPNFRIAVDAYGGGRSEFLRQVDIDEDRLARWLSWQAQVREPIWRRINKLFGLPEDSTVLFSAEQKIVEAQG